MTNDTMRAVITGYATNTIERATTTGLGGDTWRVISEVRHAATVWLATNAPIMTIGDGGLICPHCDQMPDTFDEAGNADTRWGLEYLADDDGGILTMDWMGDKAIDGAITVLQCGECFEPVTIPPDVEIDYR